MISNFFHWWCWSFFAPYPSPFEIIWDIIKLFFVLNIAFNVITYVLFGFVPSGDKDNSWFKNFPWG